MEIILTRKLLPFSFFLYEKHCSVFRIPHIGQLRALLHVWIHRLAAYAKTSELKPGESEKVSLEISVDQLTSYDEKRAAWILENGFYGIWIGNSLASAKLCGGVKLDKEVLLRQVKNLFPLKQELEEMVQEAGNTTARERAAEQQGLVYRLLCGI